MPGPSLSFSVRPSLPPSFLPSFPPSLFPPFPPSLPLSLTSHPNERAPYSPRRLLDPTSALDSLILQCFRIRVTDASYRICFCFPPRPRALPFCTEINFTSEGLFVETFAPHYYILKLADSHHTPCHTLDSQGSVLFASGLMCPPRTLTYMPPRPMTPDFHIPEPTAAVRALPIATLPPSQPCLAPELLPRLSNA